MSWLSEAVELDDRWMQKVYETAFTCTGCRRCMTYCPFGIDTQQFQAIAKAMLIAADMEPKVLTMLADVSVAKGQNIDARKRRFPKHAASSKPKSKRSGSKRRAVTLSRSRCRTREYCMWLSLESTQSFPPRLF